MLEAAPAVLEAAPAELAAVPAVLAGALEAAADVAAVEEFDCAATAWVSACSKLEKRSIPGEAAPESPESPRPSARPVDGATWGGVVNAMR